MNTFFGYQMWDYETDGAAQPDGWPVVTIAPNDTALIRVSWGNWCPNQTPAWQVRIPGSGWIDVSGMDGIAVPATAPGRTR